MHLTSEVRESRTILADILAEAQNLGEMGSFLAKLHVSDAQKESLKQKFQENIEWAKANLGIQKGRAVWYMRNVKANVITALLRKPTTISDEDRDYLTAQLNRLSSQGADGKTGIAT